jgi:crotonobetaine/carnitine-CoA ligase
MADIVANQTIADAWDAVVRCHGERCFLVFLDAAGGRVSYSYDEFDQGVNRAANAFRALGVGVGDSVIIQVCNSPEFLTCLFGLAKIGAVAVPVGVQASGAESRHIIDVCQARWAVVEGGCLERMTGLPARVRIVPVRQTAVSGTDPSFETRCAQAASTPPPRAAIDSNAVAELLFTSGTTGKPKGVMITHANAIFSGHYGIWQTSLRAEDRLFTTMPACHSNFQLAALTPVFLAGACLILTERYSASRFWAQVRAERASVVQLIAMMVRTLLLQPETPADLDNQVREALYFMPLADAEKQAFEDRFGIQLLNSYGSTESICWAVTDPPAGERRWPAVGRAGLGYQVGIFDAAGNELPPGEVGEFWIRGVPGRSLMLGYYRDPEATARAFPSARTFPNAQGAAETAGESVWMRTNDQGYIDADGWFYFVDRAQNLIKRAGENISTTEIENVLTAHPLIAEAAVIGIPDPLRDQAVKAFVLLSAGATLSVAEIEEYCASELACFKVPQHIEVVADFPRTQSMKIEKRLLIQTNNQTNN